MFSQRRYLLPALLTFVLKLLDAAYDRNALVFRFALPNSMLVTYSSHSKLCSFRLSPDSLLFLMLLSFAFTSQHPLTSCAMLRRVTKAFVFRFAPLTAMLVTYLSSSKLCGARFSPNLSLLSRVARLRVCETEIRSDYAQRFAA